MIECLVVLICVIVFIAVINGKSAFGALMRGFSKKMVYDVSKTPEGADAAYTEAIEETRKNRNEAKKILENFSGQLQESKTNLIASQKKLKDSQQICENLAKQQKFDELEVYATNVEEAQDEIVMYQSQIVDLEPRVQQAKESFTVFENQLKKYEHDRPIVVNSLRNNINSEKMYEQLDKLQKASGGSKLLGAVEDGIKETNRRVAGAKEVYESQTSTKMQRIEQSQKASRTNDYVSQLKAKYKK